MNRHSTDHLHNYLLIFILLIATIMMLWQFDSFSYSNDELSALARLDYDNFGELIEQGVKKNDFHPAGVQVFLYYWTKIFGTSETAVRFPFVIAGVLSVFFVYLIARLWFGKNTALFAAGAIAALSYPILYSQIARPYSPGLLFCMAGIYFWSKLIFENRWKDYKTLAAYIIFSALAAYTHHFSFLFMIIVGITGFFFIKKKDVKIYLLAAFIILVLYLPHINVFLYQFGIGGVGGEEGWLGPPKEGWFWEYIHYVFNDSGFLIYLCFSIVILGIAIRTINKNLQFNKFHVISVSWFLILYLIGFYYSIYRNPVLQYSILIFSFPFLFVFLFSFVPAVDKKYIYVLFTFFLFSVIYSTAIEKKYYNQQHFGEFKDIALTVDEWHQKYGSENITQAIRTNSRKYVDFYFSKMEKDYEFLQYETFNRADFLEFKTIVENSETPYFIYAWTLMGSNTPEDIVLTKYPCIVEEKMYSGLSYIALYSKDTTIDCNQKQAENVYATDYNSTETWGFNYDLITDTLGLKAASLSGIEFGPAFSRPIGEINNGNIKLVRVSFKTFSEDVGGAQNVLTYDSETEQAYEWISTHIDYFHRKDQWFDVISTFKLPEYKSKADIIMIYLWNVNKSHILMSDVKIEFFENEY